MHYDFISYFLQVKE